MLLQSKYSLTGDLYIHVLSEISLFMLCFINGFKSLFLIPEFYGCYRTNVHTVIVEQTTEH